MTATFSHSYTGPGAQHEAFLYESADEFASTATSFVSQAIECDQSALVVTSEANLEAFRGQLRELSPLVFLVDADDWYRQPAETVGRWRDFVDGQIARGRPLVRGIGEITPLRSDPGSVAGWLHYESILNTVLATLPLWVLCAYNTRSLPESTIAGARASHPTVFEHGAVSTSKSYSPPDGTPGRALSLDDVHALTRQAIDPADCCACVEAEARRAGLVERQVQQLLAAVGEVARNAFVHGGVSVFVTAWAEPERFVCQIEDDGAGTLIATAGYGTPGSGWGLWRARQSTDALEVGRGSRGSAVRLTMNRAQAGMTRRGTPIRL